MKKVVEAKNIMVRHKLECVTPEVIGILSGVSMTSMNDH